VVPHHQPGHKPLRRVKASTPNTLRAIDTGEALSTAQRAQPEANVTENVHGIKRRHSVRRKSSAAMLEPAYFPSDSDRTGLNGVAPGIDPHPGSPVAVASQSQSAAVLPNDTHPPLLMSRNLSLRHPRRNHLSLREEQGFSLGRYHKRQPIAREWNSRRKRLTAAVACLNTIFIGLIAGIYVSSSYLSYVRAMCTDIPLRPAKSPAYNTNSPTKHTGSSSETCSSSPASA
jgi:hypothetical protein